MKVIYSTYIKFLKTEGESLPVHQKLIKYRVIEKDGRDLKPL